MSLIPAPKLVLEMAKLGHIQWCDGRPVFPDGATEEQITAYWKWKKTIDEVGKTMIVFEE